MAGALKMLPLSLKARGKGLLFGHELVDVMLRSIKVTARSIDLTARGVDMRVKGVW